MKEININHIDMDLDGDGIPEKYNLNDKRVEKNLIKYELDESGTGLNIFGGFGGKMITSDMDYSTEEQLTGKRWIDGKPIYEKTFISTTKTIDLSGLNYDTLLITYFGMYVSNYIMTPYYTSSSDYLKILVTDQKQLSMITSHTSFTKAIMIIRYTKTTDKVVSLDETN